MHKTMIINKTTEVLDSKKQIYLYSWNVSKKRKIFFQVIVIISIDFPEAVSGQSFARAIQKPVHSPCRQGLEFILNLNRFTK